METPTELLFAYRNGDPEALDPFIRCVLAELRRRARYLLSNESPGHTLQPTDLVDEAFLRLFDGKPIPWSNSAEFFLVASHAMRRVLTEHARRANALKRQSRMADEFREDLPAPYVDLSESLEIDRALHALQAESNRAVCLVEMKFYGGLNNEEIAAVLGVTSRTVQREWRWAKAWLRRYLSEAGSGEVGDGGRPR